MKGKVKWFNSKKGFGFITKEDGSGDVFVHWTDIKSEGFKTLNEGEEVEFEEQSDQKGTKAVNVVRLTRVPSKQPQQRPSAGGRKPMKQSRKFERR